ncbi:MAG: DUF2125 domain-containing protein [Amylibacter sp.]|nr:DUF2125 domain-containing protein [Amylibacter sp.]
MAQENNLLASVCALTLIAGTPALSDAQSTQILEEYFASFQSSQIVLEVGDKEDNMRSTQWNNITLQGNEGAMQIAIPWIKVSKKVLGGFEMTYAQKVEAAFQSPDPKFAEPIRFVVENKGLAIEIDGEEGAREYTSSFDEITFNTLENSIVNVSGRVTGGASTLVLKAGDEGSSAGNFNAKTMVIKYDLEIDGQQMASTTTIADLTAKYLFPHFKEIDPENPLSSFDPTRDMFIEYSVGSSTTRSTIESVLGPMKVDVSFGSGAGAFSLKDSVASVSATSNDVSYNVIAAGMGMPPIQFDIKEAVVNVVVPLDNVDESKPANYKIALDGLVLSDQVWGMFDAKGLLPRDEISLDIDLSANMRWLKKLADIDLKDQNQSPPLEADSATINALNLKIAGAELITSGEVQINNSQFPPVPDGTVNVSLKGAFGLLTKLTEMGLVPAQNAMMIQGMSGMFFKPGNDGEDHLISTIVMTKDGRISANGMPLK